MKSLVKLQGFGFYGLLIGLISLSFALTGCASKRTGEGSSSFENSQYGNGASETGGIGLGTLERVHFGFDQSSLTQEAKSKLENNARIIIKNSKMRVLVEGHTDERGSNEYNIALGERRAKGVIEYLVNLGVQRSRLEMKSWGEERPLDLARTPQAYAMNRRAEFVVLSK